MAFWALAVLTGVATSVWNHATTSELAKWADRLTVSCCALLDAAFLWWAATPPAAAPIPPTAPTHAPALLQLLRLRHHDHGSLPNAMAAQVSVVGACAMALATAVGLFLAAKVFEHRCHRKRCV